MMNPAQALQIVLARWTDQWGATTPYRLDNEAFVVPVNQAWASLTFEVVGQGRQHTLGGRGARQFQRQMVLFVEIRVPANTGTALSTALVSTVLGIFEGWRDGGIMAGEVIAPRQGNTGNEYVVVVEVPFTYYELK
jgi:hypothetical protein